MLQDGQELREGRTIRVDDDVERATLEETVVS
jgi:hypothetical protein